ncbi:MAG: alpha/beta fold hydrolase [Bacteroidota bacterium]
MIHTTSNIRLESPAGRPFLLDFYHDPQQPQAPLLLFAHGFKGFKDWGHWERLAQHFVAAGFAFAKFNFSHNGTTPEEPEHFGDLEAFGQNNYSKELSDLDRVLQWVAEDLPGLAPMVDTSKIALIGHSRGGGIGIIKAAEEERIGALITWAAVSRLDYMWQQRPELLDGWKADGVLHILNGRTKQQMPLYYQLVEDFETHRQRLDARQAMQQLNKPCLIIHGDEDPAVPLAAAQELKALNPAAQLHIIKGANHVFGGSHPYTDASLPPHSAELAEQSIQFLTSIW